VWLVLGVSIVYVRNSGASEQWTGIFQTWWYALQFDKHMFSLALYLHFIAVTAENAILYKQGVANGSRTVTAFLTVTDTPQ